MFNQNRERSVPVLLIIFNRPDTTKIVFEAIRKAKPTRLYISGDGPRKGNENDKVNCEKARDIVRKVDWDCEVFYRFLDTNMGCGFGVSSGISWAFETTEQLIILEDDCVPSLPFFEFSNHCLKKYKDDTRIWTINGRSHHSNSIYFDKYDYLFSIYSHCGGWATWKRVWDGFNININNWAEFLSFGGFNNVFFSKREAKFYNNLFSKLFNDKQLINHSWAYPFNYYILSNAGLAITPSKNLIKNIGLLGVHSEGNSTFVHKLESSNDYTYCREPLFILPSREYDYFHFRKHILKVMGEPSFLKKVIYKVSRILGIR